MEKESAIYQMFYENRGCYDEIPHGEEYFKLMETVCEHEDNFEDALQKYPALLPLYEKVKESVDDLQSEALFCHFAEGLRFGFLLRWIFCKNKKSSFYTTLSLNNRQQVINKIFITTHCDTHDDYSQNNSDNGCYDESLYPAR